jgi:hypothetical protein
MIAYYKSFPESKLLLMYPATLIIQEN